MMNARPIDVPFGARHRCQSPDTHERQYPPDDQRQIFVQQVQWVRGIILEVRATVATNHPIVQVTGTPTCDTWVLVAIPTAYQLGERACTTAIIGAIDGTHHCRGSGLLLGLAHGPNGNDGQHKWPMMYGDAARDWDPPPRTGG